MKIKVNFKTELHKLCSTNGWIEPTDNYVVTNLPQLKDYGIKVAKDLPKTMVYRKFYDIVSSENRVSFQRQLQYMLYTNNVNADVFVETVARCIMFNKVLYQKVFNAPGESYFYYYPENFDKLYDGWKDDDMQLFTIKQENADDDDIEYWKSAIVEVLKQIGADEFRQKVREFLTQSNKKMLICPETYKLLEMYCRDDFYRSRIQCIVGAAGSGKSFTSRSLIRSMRADGLAKTVYVISLAGCRAEEFKLACDADNIPNVRNFSFAKFKFSDIELGSNDLCIFEEVSQFDQTHLRTILKCADHCKVIVNGDFLQNASWLNTGPLINLFGGFQPIAKGGKTYKCDQVEMLETPYRPINEAGKAFFERSRRFWNKSTVFSYEKYKEIFDQKDFAFTWDGVEDKWEDAKKVVESVVGKEYRHSYENFLTFAVAMYHKDGFLCDDQRINFCGIFTSNDDKNNAAKLLAEVFEKLYGIDTTKYLIVKKTYTDDSCKLYTGTRCLKVNETDTTFDIKIGAKTYNNIPKDVFESVFTATSFKTQGNEYENVYARHCLAGGDYVMYANSNYVMDTRAKRMYVADFSLGFIKYFKQIYKQY